MTYDLGIEAPYWADPDWLWRHACALAKRAKQAILRFVDEAQRLYLETVYARRMALRRMFLSNPRDTNSPFSKDGERVMAYMARHCHGLAPIQTNDPIMLARAEGRREALALLLADLFSGLPDFAREMARLMSEQEEIA